MTGLGVQQTNRRMCRHVLVTLLFLCWPHDVFMQDRVACEAGEATVGQTARITCSFPPGTIAPKNGHFNVKKYLVSSTDSKERDILVCYYPLNSPRENPDCVIQDTSLGYAFTFEPRNDTQTVVIPSVKLSDAGEYGCGRIGHMIDRCNLTVTGDSGRESGQLAGTIGLIVGVLLGVVVLGVLVVVLCVYRRNVRKWRQVQKDLNRVQQDLESAQEDLGRLSKDLGDKEPIIDKLKELPVERSAREDGERKYQQVQKDLDRVQQDMGRFSKDLGDNEPNMPLIIDKLKEIQKRLSNVSHSREKVEHLLHNTQLKKEMSTKLRVERPAMEDDKRKYEHVMQELKQVLEDINQAKENLGHAQQNLDQAQQNLDQAQQNLSQAQPDLGQAQQDLNQAKRVLGQAKLDFKETQMRLEQSEMLAIESSNPCMTTRNSSRRNQDREHALQSELVALENR